MTVSGSFRDPAGQVFVHEGSVLREVRRVYQDEYNHLMGSGLYEVLARSGCLVEHTEIPDYPASSVNTYKVLEPVKIPFISYPYEWSFSQLKDAALTTLETEQKALEFGMSLKDASAFNVQFLNGRPTLIDTLSFQRYREGEPWTAYKQFCQHFLAPLALMSYKNIWTGPLSLAQWMVFPLTWSVHCCLSGAGSGHRYRSTSISIPGCSRNTLAIRTPDRREKAPLAYMPG